TVTADVGDRPYFRTVLQSKEPYVQREILISRLTEKPALAMAAPVIGVDGRVQAVVIGIVNIAALDRQIRSVQFPSGGRLTVADAEGRVIIDDNTNLQKFDDNVAKAPVWKQVTQAPVGRVDSFVAHDGTSRIGGFATVPLTGWKIWFTESESDVGRQVLDT